MYWVRIILLSHSIYYLQSSSCCFLLVCKVLRARLIQLVLDLGILEYELSFLYTQVHRSCIVYSIEYIGI